MAGNNISTANISLGMDSSNAERGFNRIGAMIDGMSSRLQSATATGAAFGTFLGNVSFKAIEAGTQKVQELFKSIMATRLEIEKTDFSKMIANGAEPKELMKTDKFEQSILGGTSKMSQAWNEIVDSATTVFSPAISGVFTASADVLHNIGNWIDESFNVTGENLQSVFDNCYKMTLEISKTLVSAGSEFFKFMNNARLLFNQTTANTAWDKILLDLGVITRKEMNARANNRMGTDQWKADVAHIGGVDAVNEGIDKFKFKAIDNLNEMIQKRPEWNNLDPAKVFGVKEGAAKPLNLDAVFAPLMEAGGMADWKQTQLQRGAAQNIDQERFKKNMDKMDGNKRAIEKAADKIVAAVQNVKPSGVVGVVSIGNGGGWK